MVLVRRDTYRRAGSSSYAGASGQYVEMRWFLSRPCNSGARGPERRRKPRVNLPRFRLFVAEWECEAIGYPNASNTLRILRENLRVDVHEWRLMSEGFHLWKIVRRPRAMDLPSAGAVVVSL